MPVITEIVGRIGELNWPGRTDQLELTAEERASAHFAAETACGRHLRISLPRGTELQDGDVLQLDHDVAVVVKARDEDLLLVRPGADAVSWWGACYQLGNFHRPARFRDDGILTPSDPLAAKVLASLGVVVERIRAPFVGRRFGAAGAHHQHNQEAQDTHNHRHEGPAEPSHDHGSHGHAVGAHHGE